MKKVIFALIGTVSICYSQYGNRINFPDKSIIEVSGHGRISVRPDMAEIDIGYKLSSTNIDKAKEIVDSKLTDYINKIGKLNGKKIETTIGELRTIESNKDTIDVSRSIQLRIFDVSQIDSVLQIAYALKINFVGKVDWKNSKIETYQDSAFALAANDAKSKASSLASKFGRKIGKAYHIVNEHRNYYEGVRGSYTKESVTKLYNSMKLTVPDVYYSAYLSVIFELTD